MEGKKKNLLECIDNYSLETIKTLTKIEQPFPPWSVVEWLSSSPVSRLPVPCCNRLSRPAKE